MSADRSSSSASAESPRFATTQWSIVVAAGDVNRQDARTALQRLCETYWYPLYAYIRRRLGSAQDAQDLTQAFFCHLFEKQALARADRNRGRFRTFLLTALKNFLSNQWQRQRAEKRGAGKRVLPLDYDSGESRYQIEPSHNLSPDKLYQRRWVLTLIDRVLERLRAELASTGRADHFGQLKAALTGDMTAAGYEQAGKALGITAAAAKQVAYRLRKRYRQLFREEVAQTVADETEVDDEIDRLLAILSK